MFRFAAFFRFLPALPILGLIHLFLGLPSTGQEQVYQQQFQDGQAIKVSNLAGAQALIELMANSLRLLGGTGALFITILSLSRREKTVRINSSMLVPGCIVFSVGLAISLCAFIFSEQIPIDVLGIAVLIAAIANISGPLLIVFGAKGWTQLTIIGIVLFIIAFLNAQWLCWLPENSVRFNRY